MNRQPSRGFTSIDLLVLVLAILLAGVVCAYVIHSRSAVSRVTCQFNLKEIGLAGTAFQRDHEGQFPWMVSEARGGTLEYCAAGDQAFRHFQVLSNDINTCRLLVCPQDVRKTAMSFEKLANTNVSYFVGLDSDPKRPLSIMAGDRNITRASGVVLQCNPSAPPQWVSGMGLHGDKGHVVFSDCHVEELDSAGLNNAVQRAGMSTNRFAVP